MGLLQRLQDVLGMHEEYEEEGYEEEGYEEQSEYPYEQRQDYLRQRTVRSNVVGMPGMVNAPAEVVLMEPRSFEEVPQAVRALRDRKSVVLNLGLMDPDQAQRAADYVAGGAFAVDGHQERLGSHIFLFTPNFIQITNMPEPEPVRTPMPNYSTQQAASPWSPDSTRTVDPRTAARLADLRISPENF